MRHTIAVLVKDHPGNTGFLGMTHCQTFDIKTTTSKQTGYSRQNSRMIFN
ncbi:unnamed protein product [marine sediment metagenome]|uniref:Uncharacterized protein n=1 Tax=marine sediment metagenome TaxID=412755 RepID=X1EUM3_9ZZZZ